MSDKNRKESAKQRRAFEYYSKLKLENVDDAFQLTADEFKVKLATVYNWSSRNDWTKRYDEMERRANEKMQKELEKKISRRKNGFLVNIMNRLEEMENEDMPIAEEGLDFVRQQEILLKSFLLMTGHATERTENNNTTQVELTVEEKEMLTNLSIDIENMIEGSGEIIDEEAVETIEVEED